MKRLFIFALILSFSFNSFSNEINENLKEEEKILYGEYQKLQSQIDSFTNDKKGFLLSKASDYAEDSYANAASNSKYSLFRNSEGTIAFSEDSDGKTLIDFSFITVAPLKQAEDLVHTFFTQLT